MSSPKFLFDPPFQLQLFGGVVDIVRHRPMFTGHITFCDDDAEPTILGIVQLDYPTQNVVTINRAAFGVPTVDHAANALVVLFARLLQQLGGLTVTLNDPVPDLKFCGFHFVSPWFVACYALIISYLSAMSSGNS